MKLGQLIKKRMKTLNINVKDLSDLTGIAPTTLYSFFRRDAENINISALVKIATALEISIDSLLEGIRTETEKKFSSPSYYVSDKEKELLESFRRADSDTKSTIRHILKYADEMYKLNEKIKKTTKK